LQTWKIEKKLEIYGKDKKDYERRIQMSGSRSPTTIGSNREYLWTGKDTSRKKWKDKLMGQRSLDPVSPEECLQ
jgi:hypothetical protein